MTATARILQVFILIAMGQAFRLIGLFGEREGEVLQKFCLRFTVPVLVFFSMCEVEEGTVSAMLPMMAALVLMSVALFVVGWLCSRFVQGAARKAAVHASILFGNYGWMPFGVITALLGQAGFFRVVFFILPWWPVFYGFGLAVGLVHAHGRKEKVPLGKTLKVAVPIFACLGLGLAFHGLGWHLPRLLDVTLRPFGEMTVPLVLFSVGAMLDVSKIGTNLGPALLITAVRLVLSPLIGWGIASVLAESAVSFKVIILEAAMPVAAMTPLLAANIEIDVDLTNTAIAVSTLFSLVTIAIVAAILM